MLGAIINDDLCRVETVNGCGSPAESPASPAKSVNVVQKRSLDPSFCMAFVFGISTHGLPTFARRHGEPYAWSLLVEAGRRVTCHIQRMSLAA
jgi:hypothetical protein